jgi:hypothetical protein
MILQIVFVIILVVVLSLFIAPGYECPKCHSHRTRELRRSGKTIEVGCDMCNCVFPVETH